MRSSIVGVDFGAPRWACDQRRKIIAIAASATHHRRYRIDLTGLNARLLTNDPPGWSANELVDELLTRPARVVGFDFPFSVPLALLQDPKFAANAGSTEGAFTRWRTFNQWVARRLPLTEPLDFSSFAAWRDPRERSRLWVKRATDVAARAQPPLKDKFQATFQMTLLGNALLSRLWESKTYRVLPFPGGSGTGEVIEVYPGATLRTIGLSNYKSHPDEAVRRSIELCAARGVTLSVDDRVVMLCRRYSSGGVTPDYDVADAFVALCTAILHAEGLCRPALASLPLRTARALSRAEGAIWVPTHSVGGSTKRELS